MTMRKLSLCLSLVIGAASILLLTTAKPVQADNAAMVANDQGCTITWGANTYEGSGTEVLTHSGEWKYTCNAELVSGPGVSKTEHATGVCIGTLGSGTGDFLQNPGDHAHADCHD